MMHNAIGTDDKPTILVIDDTPENLSLMQLLLRDLYKVKGANNGERGLEIAQTDSPPDLILLDIMMPGMDGYTVCERLKSNPKTADIPVIFLTARSESGDEEKGFALGAVDYITKPISPAICLARLRTHLTLKATADFLRDKNEFLETEVSKRTREVNAIQDVTILAMASLAETRDSDTGNHIRRTQHYVRALAWKLSSHPRFREFLTVAHITMLFKSAPLHDIGKVGIPDRILLKPGRLTPEEFEIMKTHTTLGRDAIAQAEQALGLEVAFLTMAKEIAYSHQEKWDGSGYPEGLAGDKIPIPARLMAVADVYDALISRRVYKEPMPHAEAIKIIEIASGHHFDPDVVDAFLQIHQQFYAIALTYADSDHDLQRKADYIQMSLETSRDQRPQTIPGRTGHP
jgi:putative two-component system response regulator